jgi:hypothetical protein
MREIKDINLDDPRYCDGCPHLNIEDKTEWDKCNLGYFNCAIGKYLRPQKCIDEHGLAMGNA